MFPIEINTAIPAFLRQDLVRTNVHGAGLNPVFSQQTSQLDPAPRDAQHSRVARAYCACLPLWQTIGARYFGINVVRVQAEKKPRATKMYSLQAPPVVRCICGPRICSRRFDTLQFTKECTFSSSFLPTVSPVFCTADGSKLN